tara:strand:- start:38179 stop:38832 length:654 start_codon:yes stop_codon:yes gene_type:complete
MKEKYVYFNSTAAATATVGELVLTANDSSAAGNEISITIPESGTESQVTVTVSGNAITAAIGTSNDMGADNIVTAIAASADASALVTATNTGTTHITSAVSQTFLSGGEAFVGFPVSSFTGMQPTGDSELTLYFKSMKNRDGHTDGANEVITSDSVPLTLVTANTHKELMQEICEMFNSASGGYGDIIIGDDSTGNTQYASSLISAVGTIAVADANS